MLGVTVQVQIDTFKEILGDVDRFKINNSDEIFTPPNIVQDMLDLLPESVWNSKTRFLDICCKSGNFLVEIYNRLDRILSSDNNFKDPVKRRKHILENQIYGICTDSFEEMVVKRRMTGDSFSDNENISTIAYVHPVSGASKQFKELVQLKKYKTQKEQEQAFGQIQYALKEKFKQMDFDVVVGNPPYNNDMYLSFVMIGHKLAKQFTLMITPAKWQAKGGGQNDLFRKEVVPYMSKIVFYPDSRDVFDIQLQGGISYYLVGEHIEIEKKLNVYCSINKQLESERNETCDGRIIFSNIVRRIIDKVSVENNLKYQRDRNLDNKYVVAITNVYVGGGFLSKNSGNTLMIIQPYKQTNRNKRNADTTLLISFDDESCADSYIQYINSRLIRFLFFVSCCGMHLNNDYSWRFVPDPGAFDHIFTDEELYKKYNLTDDEIKLIESVIKERK